MSEYRIQQLEQNMTIVLKALQDINSRQGQIATDLSLVAQTGQTLSNAVGRLSTIGQTVTSEVQRIDNHVMEHEDQIYFLASLVLWMGTVLQDIESVVPPKTLDLILNSVEEFYDRDSGKAKKYWDLFESWRK